MWLVATSLQAQRLGDPGPPGLPPGARRGEAGAYGERGCGPAGGGGTHVVYSIMAHLRSRLCLWMALSCSFCRPPLSSPPLSSPPWSGLPLFLTRGLRTTPGKPRSPAEVLGGHHVLLGGQGRVDSISVWGPQPEGGLKLVEPFCTKCLIINRCQREQKEENQTLTGELRKGPVLRRPAGTRRAQEARGVVSREPCAFFLALGGGRSPSDTLCASTGEAGEENDCAWLWLQGSGPARAWADRRVQHHRFPLSSQTFPECPRGTFI